VPDLLLFPLLAIAWSPVLVLLHELAHALAAMALTDGDVRIEMRGAGMFGGSATYEAARIRRPRDEAWIAAAGPAVTLLVAVVLWMAWLESGADDVHTLLGAGAVTASLQLMTSALPLHYGAGLGGPADSDGRAIWRILRGTPPGGIERDLRRQTEPQRAARPVFVVLLAVVAVIAALLDPWLLAGLALMFGLGMLMQRKT
jgi:fumarate reductase subunit D